MINLPPPPLTPGGAGGSVCGGGYGQHLSPRLLDLPLHEVRGSMAAVTGIWSRGWGGGRILTFSDTFRLAATGHSCSGSVPLQSCKCTGIIALSAQIPDLFGKKSSPLAMKRLFVQINKLLVFDTNVLFQLVPHQSAALNELVRTLWIQIHDYRAPGFTTSKLGQYFLLFRSLLIFDCNLARLLQRLERGEE